MCDGIFGFIFGHNYEACADTVSTPPERFALTGMPTDKLESVIKLMTHKKGTYVRHVCRRCGKSVNRVHDEAAEIKALREIVDPAILAIYDSARNK